MSLKSAPAEFSELCKLVTDIEQAMRKIEDAPDIPTQMGRRAEYIEIQARNGWNNSKDPEALACAAIIRQRLVEELTAQGKRQRDINIEEFATRLDILRGALPDIAARASIALGAHARASWPAQNLGKNNETTNG